MADVEVPAVDEDGYALADELIAADPFAGERDLELPSGRKVRVRGLTFDEMADVRAQVAEGGDDAFKSLYPRLLIAAGLVRPKLTPAQVEAWQAKPGATGDLDKLYRRIAAMSLVGPGADTAAYKSH